ncbi:MAG: FGGY-family carbohydrate kinase [Oscillatoriales cyanobacterium C42_A2020_001]|nr:FGGY-family carbohydrate kinase [Leptolyngbyaceae cyanobacterium C42_A2020_001]
MNCYLGIDFGTSGARAIAIDDDEQMVAEVSEHFGDNPSAQWANCWKTMLFTLIQQIPAVIRAQIRAIAINGTSSTVLLCDRTGALLDAPMLYNDARGAALVATLQSLFAQDAYYRAPWQANVVSATSSLVKLLWWQQQPFFTQAEYFMHQADWLAYLLHGQPGVSDYHNALKLGYDVAQLRYPDWLEALGVMRLLPTVLPPGNAIAPIQPAIANEVGLPPTCTIRAGTTDSIAAFLASKAHAPGEAVTSLGSTLVLKLLSTTPVENAAYGIYSHRLGDLWLVGGASNTGGAVLQQFFSTAELIQLSDRIPVEQTSPLNYYPLTKPGERFPINDPHLPPQLHPRPDDPVAFLHGLLESMARIEARGYELLQQFGATPLTNVYTAGGGASNSAWTALRARHLHVPVMASQQTEAAYGTALLARRGGN